MLTTRNLFAKLEKDKRKLQNVTTKTIDASIKRIKRDENAPKSPIISTRDLGNAADIAEKKKRAEIRAERRAEEKKARKKAKKKVKLVKPSRKLKIELKKAWKEMTDKEKKIEMEARMAKARAAKKNTKKLENTGNFARIRR